MKKIEIIWRELLFSGLEKNERHFEQKKLAKKFGFSTSTVFQALKIPRKMGAVRVTGRFFILENPEKLLYHWASVRSLEKDILSAFRIEDPVFEAEGKMPPEVIYGAYSAARLKLDVPIRLRQNLCLFRSARKNKRKNNSDQGSAEPFCFETR